MECSSICIVPCDTFLKEGFFWWIRIGLHEQIIEFYVGKFVYTCLMGIDLQLLNLSIFDRRRSLNANDSHLFDELSLQCCVSFHINDKRIKHADYARVTRNTLQIRNQKIYELQKYF